MRYLVVVALCLSASLSSFAQSSVPCGGLFGNAEQEHNGGGTQDQMLFTELQQMSGWGTCDNGTCSGGTGGGTCWIEPYQVQPSVSGSSTEISVYTVSDDALFYKKLTSDGSTWYDTVDYVQFTFSFMIDANALSSSQALEFDSFNYAPGPNGDGYRCVLGTQCDYGYQTGFWDFWNADYLNQNGTHGAWIHQNGQNGTQYIFCPRQTEFNPYTWYTVVETSTLSKSAGTYTFQSVVISGGQYGSGTNILPQPITYNAYQASTPSNFGAQFQIDVVPSCQSCTYSYHEWFDNVSLSVEYAH
jgi:hypothetical protein